MIHIYTKHKISNYFFDSSIFATTPRVGGYYRYAACKEDSSIITLIYTLIIETLCKNHGCDRCADKLCEYFKMMGYMQEICADISGMLNESDTVHIDGIVNFRLKNYACDVKAFFDMIIHAETIKKSFSALPVKCTISFLE